MSVTVFSAVTMPAKAFAACNNGQFFGLPTWYQYLETAEKSNSDGSKTCEIVGPASDDGSGRLDVTKVATLVILAVIDILLRVGGIVAFVFVFIGGAKYVQSQGDPGKEKEARATIINALIGVAITVIATGAVTFIGRTLSN